MLFVVLLSYGCFLCKIFMKGIETFVNDYSIKHYIYIYIYIYEVILGIYSSFKMI